MSASKKLEMSMSYTKSCGVQNVGYFTVLAISPTLFFSCFLKYFVVNNPTSLTIGLHKFYCGEGANDLSESAFEFQMERESTVEHKGEKLTSLEQVWRKNMQDVYSKQVENVRKALYLAISPAARKCNVMSIDLCFVMDTTGSMTPHIEAAKAYIRKMSVDIKRNVESSSGKTAKLRIGFVSYKVAGNVGHLQNQPFTENIADIHNMLLTVRASGGRGNEDKYDGVLKAVNFSWEGIVKFLVLIGDVPGYENRTQALLNLIGSIARKEIYVMYVAITSRTNAECETFRRSYIQNAPQKMKSNGFKVLNLWNTNDSKKLEEMITGGIDKIICSEFL